jgi:Domain of unknown function (DUF4838)
MPHYFALGPLWKCGGELPLPAAPSYHTLAIGNGWGLWPDRGDPWNEWRRANGVSLDGGIANCSEAGAAMYRALADILRQHPEYQALVAGRRTGKDHKFCLSNPDCRKAIIQHYVLGIRNQESGVREKPGPTALIPDSRFPIPTSVSVSPSDGDGWCECGPCQAMGSITNRVVTLANEAQKAADAAGRALRICTLAYYKHAAPPTIPVHPRVVVVVSDIARLGHDLDQLLIGWKRAGVTDLGVYLGLSIYQFDLDLPGGFQQAATWGGAKVANQHYLKTALSRWHALGVRHLVCETSDNWWIYGLGHYLTARLCQDVHADASAIVRQFLSDCFGSAATPMGRFFETLNGANRPLLSTDLIHRLYDDLLAAREATNDRLAQSRILQLVKGVRHASARLKYLTTPVGRESKVQESKVQSPKSKVSEGGATLDLGPGTLDFSSRQAAFNSMLASAYAARGYVHSLAICNRAAWQDGSVSWPRDSVWKVEPRESDAQLRHVATLGLAANPANDWKPVGYSGDLVPARNLRLPTAWKGTAGGAISGKQVWWTFDPVGSGIWVKGGLVRKDVGEVRVRIFHKQETRAWLECLVPADGAAHPVDFSTESKGLHRIEIEDGGGGTQVTWDTPQAMTLRCGPEDDPPSMLAAQLVFYVPRGTTVVAGYAWAAGVLGIPGGVQTHVFASLQPGYFAVPVKPGQDGRLWQAQFYYWLELHTVPPCLARNARELLLPKEVAT